MSSSLINTSQKRSLEIDQSGETTEKKGSAGKAVQQPSQSIFNQDNGVLFRFSETTLDLTPHTKGDKHKRLDLQIKDMTFKINDLEKQINDLKKKTAETILTEYKKLAEKIRKMDFSPIKQSIQENQCQGCKEIYTENMEKISALLRIYLNKDFR